jgi:hypothetical protein
MLNPISQVLDGAHQNTDDPGVYHWFPGMSLKAHCGYIKRNGPARFLSEEKASRMQECVVCAELKGEVF